MTTLKIDLPVLLRHESPRHFRRLHSLEGLGSCQPVRRRGTRWSFVSGSSGWSRRFNPEVHARARSPQARTSVLDWLTEAHESTPAVNTFQVIMALTWHFALQRGQLYRGHDLNLRPLGYE